MRYREGEIPKEQLAVHASDDMLILTAVMGFFIGLLISFLGSKGKILWMKVWGIGLVLCSAYLFASMLWGIRLFGFV